VKDRGIVGLTQDVKELLKMIVRVGAPEYEPAEQIKNFTLRAQCEDIVRQDLIEKLKRQLNFIRELRELT